MKKISIIIAMFISFMALTARLSAVPKQTGSFELNLTYQSNPVNVAFYVPESYDETKKYNVLIGVHSSGSSCVAMREMISKFAKDLNLILVCPSDPNFEGGIINPCIDFLKTHYSVNAQKIILCGYADGCQSVFRYGFSNYQSIAGIIGLAPAVQDYSILDYSLTKTLPIGMIIGTKDEYKDIVDYMVEEMNYYKGKIKYIVKKDVDHVDPYYSSTDFSADWLACYNFILNSTSSVNDLHTNSSLSLSPNPVADIAIINLEGNDNSAHKLSLCNQEGINFPIDNKYNFTDNNSKLMLNTAGLSNGVYFLKVQNNNSFQTAKFVVMR